MGFSTGKHGRRHSYRLRAHGSDRLAGQNELAEACVHAVHSGNHHMIPVAGINDQELAVGAERAGIDNPSIAGGDDLGACPGDDGYPLRDIAKRILVAVAGEDPAAAAARELREETGLVADDWHVIVDIAASPGFCDETVRVYLARGLRNVGRPPAHHEEADLTVHWLPLTEAVDRVLAGQIVNATAVAGVLSAHAVIVDGKPCRPLDAPWPDRPSAFAARLEGL